MNVATILKTKGTRVVTVTETTPILEAACRMTYDRIGALLVSRNGRDIEGIITERDVLHALAANGARLMTMKVEDIMTRHVESCTPQDDLKHVMSAMARHRFRHMPVVGDNGLCGMISVGDIVKQRLQEGEAEGDVARDALTFAR